MNPEKTKAVLNIEKRMESLEPDSIRYKILKDARDFKTSWISFGQALFCVWKDKKYKEWGFIEFDAYTTKEIGIRKETALKLMRSYSFLENKEPRFLEKAKSEETEASKVPDYEAVDVLRRAESNKSLDQGDYARIKKYVLEDGKDAKEVKRDLTEILKQKEELDPEDVRRDKRATVVKRFIGQLRALEREIKISKLVPASTLKDLDEIIAKIESGIED